VKGQEWYQAEQVASDYESKRFTGGGRLIDRREKEAVLAALAPLEDQKVLEIACGTGRFTVMLAEESADIVGLDISAPMLQEARQKAQQKGVDDRLEFMRGDAARLPFPDNHFDTVFAMRFFHLTETPVSFLTEMARVSKEQVFFDTFNRFSTRSIYNWLLPMGSRLYNQQEVEQLLLNAGLRLARENHDFVLPFGLYRQLPGNVADVIRRLDASVGETPAGNQLSSVSYWNAQVR
jgi:ubiquinone/menaquinone biosynthesis C-methylase UbiE